MKRNSQPRSRRRIWRAVWAGLLIVASGYGILVVTANYSRAMPSLAVVTNGRVSATDWILAHRVEVLDDDSSILWSMVARSVALTGDPALRQLLDEYVQRHMVPQTDDAFRQLFGLSYRDRYYSPESIEHLQDYQVFLLYGVTCDEQLLALERVRAQLKPGFCPAEQTLRPACATHQLMGLRLAEEFRCLPAAETSSTKEILLNRIERQLFWDVRFVDTYIQRALMLTEERGHAAAGAPALDNILGMRMSDGGWSRSQPILPVGGGNWLGVKESGFGVVEERGQFHATAQVLLLLSLVESGLANPAP